MSCSTHYTLSTSTSSVSYTQECPQALASLKLNDPQCITDATITKTFNIFGKKTKTPIPHASCEELQCHLKCAISAQEPKDQINCAQICWNFDSPPPLR